ncbi:hypothetical protein LTR78_000724 [Recurvomyces mirabilis]|uniref:Uncharacterized protein n=1 Tax=Recurvomyces mirabilis TaxID=574656 RepID=A0AAE1C5R9_9PEZI|nr:hypothetical protein LTR78_000724 [Recurvomyces mirabilis]KAK5158694.1 hypothetical protein LTS14_002802 [Recurvomyces mirabilis]
MAPIRDHSHLVNSLATSTHLETSASQLDSVPRHLEDSIRYETSRLSQAAGILLSLPQEIIAQSIIVMQRFWVGPEGGSMLEYDPQDVASAAMYLCAKPSGFSLSPRSILTTFECLRSLNCKYDESLIEKGPFETEWRLSDGEYETRREQLYKVEAQILRTLGFQTHVALPYTLSMNYLQTLEAFHDDKGPVLARRVFAHLNSALLSPQLLYLTHQPCALATASIYLAAREVGALLPEAEWWEVFDVEREELGFLVVALRSMEAFAVQEKRQWESRVVPLTIHDVRGEIERERMLEADE